MSEHIQLTMEGAVARLLINNPAQANALDVEALQAIRAALERVNESRTIRVLLLEATGKYFCSGFNIGKMKPESGGTGFEATVNMLEGCAPVTIACLEGGVYGGGTDLALACDFRLGVAGCNMFMPAARLGIHLYGSALRRYVTRLGMNHAKTLVLTAREATAPQMQQMGYLTHLFDTVEELRESRDALVRDIAQLAPLSLKYMKKNINRIANGEFDADAIGADALLVGASQDSAEGRLAWREKRHPQFKGE